MLKTAALYTIKYLSVLTANSPMQRVLYTLVQGAQALMGIGVGSETNFGETASIKRCAKDAIIFDVGANIGQFARLVQSTLSSCQLYCFEPGKHTFAALSQNVRDAELLNIALGEKPCVLTLYYDQPASGMASLTRRRLDHFAKTFDLSEEVEVETIDRICVKFGITRIDLLKIDVEGHELDVLRGATDMLSKRAIKAVQFEFGGCNIDTRTYFQDLFYFMKNYGMLIHRITPCGYLYPLPHYREIDEQFRTTNLLAVLQT